MQLYVPPSDMINKDFLRQVLCSEKNLLDISACRFCNVPKYDELSVRNLYSKYKGDPQMMQYFPDSYAKDKGPSRQYFFTVLNTVHPDHVQELVTFACKQRFASDQEENKNNEIQMTSEWWEKLNSMPFISCKSDFKSNFCSF